MRATVQNRTKIRGIVRDAEILGVCRTHLRRVLVGQRESMSLMARYKALKKAQLTRSHGYNKQTPKKNA